MYYTERRPKNKKQGRPGNEATGAHDVIAITSLQKNDFELRNIDRAKATLELTLWHKILPWEAVLLLNESPNYEMLTSAW